MKIEEIEKLYYMPPNQGKLMDQFRARAIHDHNMALMVFQIPALLAVVKAAKKFVDEDDGCDFGGACQSLSENHQAMTKALEELEGEK